MATVADAAQRYYVAVIGGGVMGSATAWHLLADAPGMSVAVIEPDPAYAGAASSAASGGVRQLFSRPRRRPRCSRSALHVTPGDSCDDIGAASQPRAGGSARRRYARPVVRDIARGAENRSMLSTAVTEGLTCQETDR